MTGAMAMPAMAPEDKSEGGGIVVGVVVGVVGGLDIGNDEDVVASCLITRCVRDIRRVVILTWNRDQSARDAT